MTEKLYCFRYSFFFSFSSFTVSIGIPSLSSCLLILRPRIQADLLYPLMLYVLPLHDVGCGLHLGWLCLLLDHNILPGFYTMFHHLLCYSIIAGMNSAHKHHADPVHFIPIITATVVIIHTSIFVYLSSIILYTFPESASTPQPYTVLPVHRTRHQSGNNTALVPYLLPRS